MQNWDTKQEQNFKENEEIYRAIIGDLPSIEAPLAITTPTGPHLRISFADYAILTENTYGEELDLGKLHPDRINPLGNFVVDSFTVDLLATQFAYAAKLMPRPR